VRVPGDGVTRAVGDTAQVTRRVCRDIPGESLEPRSVEGERIEARPACRTLAALLPVPMPRDSINWHSRFNGGCSYADTSARYCRCTD